MLTPEPGERVVKKSLGHEPPRVAERHAVIAQAHAEGVDLSVRAMCRLLSVNRAWYSAQQRPGPGRGPAPAFGAHLRQQA